MCFDVGQYIGVLTRAGKYNSARTLRQIRGSNANREVCAGSRMYLTLDVLDVGQYIGV